MKNVEIIAVAHALVQGTRGANGGAASKDSVFGVAKIQGNLVTFGGRRGGVLRFKTERKVDLDKVMDKFNGKLTGRPFGKNVDATYNDVTKAEDREALLPNLAETVGRGFYKAMANKKLNTNSTKPKAKVAEVAAA